MSEQQKLTPIQDFVRSVLEESMAGFPPGFRFAGPVKFRMSVVTKDEGGGQVKAYVVNVGGKFEAQELKEVTFEVTNAGEDPVTAMQREMLKQIYGV